MSNLVSVRFNVLHILNEIHNHPDFGVVGGLITPQGLVTMICAANTTPRSMEEIITTILFDRWGKGLQHLHDMNRFSCYCEEISMEIDAICSSLTRHITIETPFFFGAWSNLAELILVGSIDMKDSHALHQQALRAIDSYRYYDGSNAVGGGYGGSGSVL